MRNIVLMSLLSLGACRNITQIDFGKDTVTDKSAWTVDTAKDNILSTNFIVPDNASTEEKAALYKTYSQQYFTTEADCKCRLPQSLSALVTLYNEIVQ